MLSKEQAKIMSTDKFDKSWLEASIWISIYEAIFNQQFKCEWCSPVYYNLEITDSNFINEKALALIDNGYSVTVTPFNTNDCNRIKLLISWDF